MPPNDHAYSSEIARKLVLGSFSGDADVAKTQPATVDLGPMYVVTSSPVEWSVIPYSNAGARVDGQGLTIDAALVKVNYDSAGAALGYSRVASSAESNGGVETGHHLELQDPDVKVGAYVYLSILGFTNPGGVDQAWVIASAGLRRVADA